MRVRLAPLCLEVAGWANCGPESSAWLAADAQCAHAPLRPAPGTGQEYFEAPQMVDMGSRSSSNPNSMAGEPGGPRKKSSGLLTKLGMKGRNGSSLLATGEL